MARHSIRLLDDTQAQINVTGPAVKAAGYYGSTKGVHTAAIYLNDFTGRVYIEATLASDPEENDWFPINLNGNLEYLEYPFIPTDPSGPHGDNGIDSVTFDGNFVFIRAKIDRSYLTTPADPLHGSIRKILVNF